MHAFLKEIKARAIESAFALRTSVNYLIDYKWNNYPFGRKILADKSTYINKLNEAKTSEQNPDVLHIEARTGFAIEKEWLDQLALHTQIVFKHTPVDYQHGRLLYSMLMKKIISENLDWVNVLETGTARGFSSICMSKAIEDSEKCGVVLSVDVLPHFKKQIWNCIDDHDGEKSREELLQPWNKQTKRIIFIQGDTKYTLPRLGVSRVHFAYLDAQHIESSVLEEFDCISKRQLPGDVIVFDDVTEHVFPGVVKAVETIKQQGDYEVEILNSLKTRGYAIATKKCH